MNNKNIFWILAGSLCLMTTLLHLIGGQMTLIDPMLETSLDPTVKTELLGAWHMVSVVIVFSTYIYLYHGIKRNANPNIELIQHINYLNLAFAVVFVAVSLYRGFFAPQWIFFLPIGIFGILGLRKYNA